MNSNSSVNILKPRVWNSYSTQDELAQRAGISARYLCDIENDHGIPSDLGIRKFAAGTLQSRTEPHGRRTAFVRRAALTVSRAGMVRASLTRYTTAASAFRKPARPNCPYQKRFEIMSQIERFNPEMTSYLSCLTI